MIWDAYKCTNLCYDKYDSENVNITTYNKLLLNVALTIIFVKITLF